MTLGIFIFGVFVTAIVASACWLIAAGIRDEQRDRKQLESEQAGAIGAARGRRVATRADGRTVEAE